MGLALEPGKDLNNKLATSNKLLLYLLGGLAIAATNVPGQRAILVPDEPGWELYTPGDIEALAAILHRWVSDPLKLQRDRVAALEAARSRWNWEQEAENLVSCVSKVLPLKRSKSRNVSTEFAS